MRILNLSFPDNSEIKYKISKFPDGQQDIVIDKSSIPTTLEGRPVPICITSRFNSFLDLELIICTTKALRRLSVLEIHLYIPYLLGARSDRHFQEGGNSYLVDVIAPIINAQSFRTVMVMDVHSDVAPACIHRLTSISNKKLLDFFWKENPNNGWGSYVFISPDGGALKKIYKLADSLGFKGDIVTCSKSRNEKGELSRVLVPLNTRDHSDKEFVIIDDICDGGRTFINIADNIKQNGYTKNKIHLVVTHGVFSRGFMELLKYFDVIYSTNSYSDAELGEAHEYYERIKQLNIF